MPNNFISFIVWAIAWNIGGYLITHSIFQLRRERFIVGIAIGLVLQLWFSNWMAYLMPVPYSFWMGAGIVFVIGLVGAWPFRKQDWRELLSIPVWQALTFAFLLYLFFSIGRGLDIFDDFQNVTTTSIMAAGDIPPHFPFAPELRFGYHYLLLLFSAQLARLGGMFPWNAMDLARAASLSLLLMLVYLWARRMTRSQLAGWLAAFFVAFAGGVRWLLLVFPPSFVERISENITLMGSGAVTAHDLASALTAFWRIEGDGPIQFPFAYANGVNPPATMSHGGVGVLGLVVFLLLIMLFRRLRDYKTGFILAALLAAYALTGEYTFLIVYPSLGLALLIHWIRTRKLSIPRSLIPTLIVSALALAFALLQGGVLTEILRGLFAPATGEESFHTFQFTISLPSLVSGHLGFISLLNPYQLLAGLFEIGPVIFFVPLLLIWGVKMIRAQKWWEAGMAASVVFSTFSLFLKYDGTAGESANARLLSTLVIPPAFYAVPLGWTWLKGRSEQIKIGFISISLACVFGGLMFFGIQLIAAQKPVLPVFISDLDVTMEKRFWDQLPGDAMVFDPEPRRAVTVFGRSTDAMVFWQVKPSWEILLENPDPYKLNSAGFDYVYFGVDFWGKLSRVQQKGLQNSCVKLVDEVQGYRAADDYRKDFRRLLDISACK
jgi:hypothetical protein